MHSSSTNLTILKEIKYNSHNVEFQKQQEKETDGDCVDHTKKSWDCQTVPMFVPKVLHKITATLRSPKIKAVLSRGHIIIFFYRKGLNMTCIKQELIVCFSLAVVRLLQLIIYGYVSLPSLPSAPPFGSRLQFYS